MLDRHNRACVPRNALASLDTVDPEANRGKQQPGQIGPVLAKDGMAEPPTGHDHGVHAAFTLAVDLDDHDPAVSPNCIERYKQRHGAPPWRRLLLNVKTQYRQGFEELLVTHHSAALDLTGELYQVIRCERLVSAQERANLPAMVIGTMHLGDVDSLGSEHVTTKFFVFGALMIPLGSIYMIGPERGFDIPLQLRSVGLGYLRITSWMMALIVGLLHFTGAHASGAMLAWTVVAAVIAVVSTFVLGRLSGPERRRRAILAAVTGLGAPPEWVPENLRSATQHSLEDAWAKGGDGRSWETAIAAGADDPALFVLAEYGGRRDLAAAVLANMARHVEPSGQPYR